MVPRPLGVNCHPRDIVMRSNGTTREPRRTILIPLVIGCAFFMEGLDSTMIAVAIPDMAESLGEHPLRLNLVITSYLLSLAVFIPLSGWIAHRIGALRVVVEPADDAADARRAGVRWCHDDTRRPPDPAAQLSALGARLGDELDDDPGDDRADRGTDRRRLSDDLFLMARDLLPERPDRHRRFRTDPLPDRQLPRAGADQLRSPRLCPCRLRAEPPAFGPVDLLLQPRRDARAHRLRDVSAYVRVPPPAHRQCSSRGRGDRRLWAVAPGDAGLGDRGAAP